MEQPLERRPTDTASAQAQPSLYGQLLGDDADRLDRDVARLHCSSGGVCASGDLRVRRGAGPLAQLAAALLRLPRSGREVTTSLSIIRHRAGEHWIRVFGDSRPLCSRQRADTANRLVEHIGPLRLTFALEAEGETLRFRQQSCRLALAGRQLSIPAGVAPRVEAAVRPAPADGAVAVSVTISTPLTGRLLSYAGVMSIREELA